MAISLNNHESRIKALENKGSGSWSKGSNSNGNWIKDSVTGVLIQWGLIGRQSSQRFTVNMPLSYSDKNYAVITSLNGESWTPSDFSNYVIKSSANAFQQHQTGIGYLGGMWLAIGYLISNRILNYAYACKSLLFTPLRKIGGVK